MRAITLSTLAAIALTGCSTRPREFQAKLATPPADELKYAEAQVQCQVMVRRGVKNNFASAAAQFGAGSAGGILASTAAIGAFSGASSTGFLSGAAVTAGTSALLIAGPLAGFGVSRLIRTSREKKYKAALGNCLTEYGYTPQSWEKRSKLTKDQVKAVMDKWAAAPSTPAPVAAPVPVPEAPQPK